MPVRYECEHATPLPRQTVCQAIWIPNPQSQNPTIPQTRSAWMNYSGNWGIAGWIKSSINKVGIWITWIKHKCKRIASHRIGSVRFGSNDRSAPSTDLIDHFAVAQPHLARHSRGNTTDCTRDFKLKFCTLQEQEINSATMPHWCMSRLGVRCVYVELSKCKAQ